MLIYFSQSEGRRLYDMGVYSRMGAYYLNSFRAIVGVEKEEIIYDINSQKEITFLRKSLGIENLKMGWWFLQVTLLSHEIFRK